MAAVALGSSTYAWFVSNTEVKATTSTISAQSDSAFMYIRNQTRDSQDLQADTADITDNTKLYPTHWALQSEVNTYTSGAEKFYTASGTAADSNGYTMKDGTLKLVSSGDSNAAGSAEAAVAGKYAVKNTFKIGSKGNELSDLIVSNASISGSGNTTLDNALRVLVKCEDKWVLCDKDGIKGSSDSNKLADTVPVVGTNKEGEVIVELYVFYDGDDSQIYTNNLGQLEAASNNITVTFTAK